MFCALIVATYSQATAQDFEFIDGAGDSLFEISYSALPGTATDISAFQFTSIGEALFGIDGSEDFVSLPSGTTSFPVEQGSGGNLQLSVSGSGVILFAPDNASSMPFDDRLDLEVADDGFAILGVGSQSTSGILAFAPSSVPEPSCLMLGLAGLIGVFTKRRRQ